MKFTNKKQALGLDIGHHSIKAALLEASQSGWHVIRHASMLVPEEMIKEGVILDPESLGRELKSFLRSHQMLVSTVSIAVGGGSAVVRPVKIPKMADIALRKSLKIEASRYIPNSVDDSYVDFAVMGMADETNMDVLIAAAPKDVTDSRILTCEHAGLEVVAVEIGAFATFRALLESNPNDHIEDKTVAILDIGSMSTHFSVISKGKFSMTRAIQAGGYQLTEQLQSYFKLAYLDAESGKAQLDLAQLTHESKPTENPPLRVLQPLVDDLVREVRRSINYWQSQISEVKGNKQLDQIYLCGGGANFKGIDRYFEVKLSIPTIVKGAFDSDNIMLHTTTDDSHGAEWPLAYGLAMANTKLVKSNHKQSSHSVQEDTKADAAPVSHGKKRGRKSKAASEPFPEQSYDVSSALYEMEGKSPEPELLGQNPTPAKPSWKEKFKKMFAPKEGYEGFEGDEVTSTQTLGEKKKRPLFGKGIDRFRNKSSQEPQFSKSDVVKSEVPNNELSDNPAANSSQPNTFDKEEEGAA